MDSCLLVVQENERQLSAKEASLPQEPTPDDENAVTLLVRMPDGSRRGRRFLKSDTLQVTCWWRSIFTLTGLKYQCYVWTCFHIWICIYWKI